MWPLSWGRKGCGAKSSWGISVRLRQAHGSSQPSSEQSALGAVVGGLGNNTAVEVVKKPSLLHKKASPSQGSLWKRSAEFLGTVNRRWAVTRWGFAKFIYVIITYLVLAFRLFLHRDPSEPGKLRGQPGSFLE